MEAKDFCYLKNEEPNEIKALQFAEEWRNYFRSVKCSKRVSTNGLK